MTCILQRLTYLEKGVNNATDELMKIREQAHADHRAIFEKDGTCKRWLSQGAFAGDLDMAVEKASQVQEAFEEFLADLYNIMLQEKK